MTLQTGDTPTGRLTTGSTEPSELLQTLIAPPVRPQIRGKTAGSTHFRGARLTFLTESAGEAVHALALLPGPAVQTGAPVSAGAGGAGSFQSRTSADTQNPQSDSETGGGQEICMLKDPSSPFTGKFSGILQCVKNLLFEGENRLLIPPGGAGTDVPQRERGRGVGTGGEHDGQKREASDRRDRPVKDAARRQRLTGLQRAAVHGELHDAAHKVVGGDLPPPVQDGFY